MASQDAEHHYDTGWGWLKFDGLYRQYMHIWVWLAVLTVVEVFIPEPHIFAELFEALHLTVIPGVEWVNAWLHAIEFPRVFVVISLILLALVKTWLVAWYYMHLISERPTIILVAAAPFIFSVFLTIGLFPWQTTFGIETLLFVP